MTHWDQKEASIIRKPPLWLRWGYSFVYGLFCLAYLPHFIRRSLQAEDQGRLWRERWGLFTPSEAAGPVLWVHAVSVGEVMAAEAIMKRLLETFPEVHLVLTTVTPTGQTIAQKFKSARVTVCYCPFDFAFSLNAFIRRFKPKALLLMETEIWPGMLMQAKQAGLPAAVLNARLSDKSLRRYQRFKSLLGPVLQCLDCVIAQTQEDAARFQRLGLPGSRIQTAGNLKFDTALGESDPSAEARFKDILKPAGARLWIAGSTHEGEEVPLLNVFEKLRVRHPELKLMIAPRHIQRSDSILKFVQIKGFRVQLSTVMDVSKDTDVVILNELGVLKHLYSLADWVFMGGSLVRHGGQNPIEPASRKRAVLYGTHVFNFKSVYRELASRGAACQVADEADLLRQSQEWLSAPQETQAKGLKAFEFVQTCQGAAERHLQGLMPLLSFLTTRKEVLCSQQ